MNLPRRLNVQATKARLKKLGAAHIAFEKEHGHFVGIQSSDPKTGKPLLSWRVHLLPFLGQKELYDQFNLDEPWDSNHNKTLVEKMPSVYQHPTLQLKTGTTVFVSPVGEDCVLTSAGVAKNSSPLGSKRSEITDGQSTTAVVLEAGRTHAITWTQPDDLKDEGHKVSHAVYGNGMLKEFIALFADGSVRMIPLKKLHGDDMSWLVRKKRWQ